MGLAMKIKMYAQCVVFLWLVVFGQSACAHPDIITLLNKPVQGGIAVVILDQYSQHGQLPSVSYRGNRVLVANTGEHTVAIVGIPLKTKAGKQTLEVLANGKKYALSFDVHHKKYTEQHITLKSDKHVNPSKKNLARFSREYKEQIDAYKNYRQQTPSHLVLDRPVEGGRYSGPFGVRRFFNGQERNPHSGLDISVPQGTPVKASADGVITIVGDYFFNGKTVFVDHGQGMISMYCHLSHIDVKKGQLVKRGEVVGKVGATGRATGPHLHWSVSLNNTRIDPAIFVDAFQP